MGNVEEGVVGVEKVDGLRVGHGRARGGQPATLAENLRLGTTSTRPKHLAQRARTRKGSACDAADQAVGDQPAGRIERFGPDRSRPVAEDQIDQRALGSCSTRSAMISRWISELPAAIVSTQDHMKT